MNGTKKQELKYNEQHTMIVKSRNGVIIMNRIILLASISIALVFIFKGNWISVLLVFAISYILSILQGFLMRNRLKYGVSLKQIMNLLAKTNDLDIIYFFCEEPRLADKFGESYERYR